MFVSERIMGVRGDSYTHSLLTLEHPPTEDILDTAYMRDEVNERDMGPIQFHMLNICVIALPSSVERAGILLYAS